MTFIVIDFAEKWYMITLSETIPSIILGIIFNDLMINYRHPTAFRSLQYLKIKINILLRFRRIDSSIYMYVYLYDIFIKNRFYQYGLSSRFVKGNLIVHQLSQLRAFKT